MTDTQAKPLTVAEIRAIRELVEERPEHMWSSVWVLKALATIEALTAKQEWDRNDVLEFAAKEADEFITDRDGGDAAAVIAANIRHLKTDAAQFTPPSQRPMTNPTDTAEEAAPSPEHVEHVARAIYEHARATYAKKAMPWDMAPEHGREVIRQEAALVILASQEWERNNETQRNTRD